MTENEISSIAINAAIEVHKTLGPGLLESSYEICLFYELIQAGLHVERQKPLPIYYKGIKLNAGYKIDLLVEDKLVIELKAVNNFNSVHTAQLLTYLRLSKCKLGLLLNFNVKLLKEGIKRIVNRLN